MPHSLRVKIKRLRYKGIITDKDCDRLCKALDNEDALDKIRAEITEKKMKTHDAMMRVFSQECIDIIDKYKTKVEPQERSEE